jgi:hypothetical protein
MGGAAGIGGRRGMGGVSGVGKTDKSDRASGTSSSMSRIGNAMKELRGLRKELNAQIKPGRFRSFCRAVSNVFKSKTEVAQIRSKKLDGIQQKLKSVVSGSGEESDFKISLEKR